MAYLEGSYKNLLFGVSEQARQDRLDGQVESQINMVSDLAFGLRRRAGLALDAVISRPSGWVRGAQAYTTAELASKRVLVTVDTGTGGWRIQSYAGTVEASGTAPYLVASARQSIQFAQVGDELFIANTERRPVEVDASTSSLNSATCGFFYIAAGAYSRQYTITITVGGASYNVSVTSGSTSVPEKAQPESIAQALLDACVATAGLKTTDGFTYTRVGAYVFIQAPGTLLVSSGTGSTYLRASNSQYVSAVGELPADLPPNANGFIVAVGTGTSRPYYRWQHSSKSWVEDAAQGSAVRPSNMPMRVRYASGWVVESPEYEARSSGDTDSNKSFQIFTKGITGITSFQGRLVLLARDYVCMSGSTEPTRFYRSTVTSLAADDPVEVACTTSRTTPYRFGVQFNQSLVLFADAYQAVIPGGTPVTPSNAVVSIASLYTTSTDTPPTAVGNSVFFTAPRSSGFGAIWEMTPSPYSDTQLSAQDVTGHIPQYIKREFKFLTASSTTNILMVADSLEDTGVVIHEYLWEGTQKSHQAWHRWSFGLPVEYGFFDGDTLHIMFLSGTSEVFTTLDVRQGAGELGKETARLDYFTTATADADGLLTIDKATSAVWKAAGAELVAYSLSGDYPYVAELPTPVNSTTLKVMQPGVKYQLGLRFTSSISPTPPVVRDYNKIQITTQRAQLHKFVLSVQNTGQFSYVAEDHYRKQPAMTVSPLSFGSPELDIGAPLMASGTVYIPCRLELQSTDLTLYSDDVFDMNITGVEYGYRYSRRYGKRA